MKKLLKGALTLAIATIVGIPQMQAATNDYRIEVKNYTYSKQTRDGLYGVTYTEDNATYTDKNWPLAEMSHAYTQSNYSYSLATAQMVRQFGVSMGVVYWINPAENYIYWWNTVTGENGKTRPTKSYGVGYADGINNPNFDFTFLGAETGSGAIAQDWYGNLVHMWNDGLNGWGTTAGTHFVQGYAVYKSAKNYGELMDFIPKLSKMNDTGRASYPFYRRLINASDGKLTGSSTSNLANFEYFAPTSNTPNPNYPARSIDWANKYYHKANTTITKEPTDFLGVSGNLWGKGVLQGSTELAPSSYYNGYSTGQIFHACDTIVYGNMFADGQYTNWYLNYALTVGNRTASGYYPWSGLWKNTYRANYWHPRDYSFENAPTEYLFMESDVLEYFWSVPYAGLAEYSGNRDGNLWQGYVDDLNYSSYIGTTTANRHKSDQMSSPEVDSIKGTRVIIHNYWLQWMPFDISDTDSDANKRNGSIMIQYSKYSGDAPTHSLPRFTGKPTRTYAPVGYTYGWAETDVTTNLATPTPNFPVKFQNTTVSSWNELERVNDNVFALYTHVPGRGFSKTFITAVKPNNPVSSLKVAQSWNSDGEPVHILTWTPQAYDQATMHTYEVWYRKKNGSTYEDTKTIDGASRAVWNFAGKAHVEYNGDTDSTTTHKYSYIDEYGNTQEATITMPKTTTFYNSYTAESCKFEFVAPRGDNGDGTKYERTYEYMVIPVYDRSAHRGTEATTSIVTAPAPSKIYGNLYQVTDKNANGETLYGFSIRLDPYFLPGALGSTEAKRLIITSAGDKDGSINLEDAVSVTLADGTPLTPQEGITFQSTSSGGTTTHGAYALSIDITGKVGADGKLPSIIWHNVNPTLEFQLAAHIESTSEVQYSGTGTLSTTLVIPQLVWSTTPADFYKLAGDYGSLTGNEDMPIGSFRRIDPVTNVLDVNPSNPVTLNNANYYGTNGSMLKPVYVTEEVFGALNDAGEYENAGWRVAYGIYIYDENGDIFAQTQLKDQLTPGGYAACYSNINDVICDAIGLKVDYKEEVGEDGRIRKVYNPTRKTYTAKVDVAYRRLNAQGEKDGLEVIKTTDAQFVIGSTRLPELGVKHSVQSAVTGALYQRSGSHFYYEDAAHNGYYPYYYDAAMLFNWDEYNLLNRYMGYYGKSKSVCYGHYETDAEGNRLGDEWVEYHAGSVLPDDEIDLLLVRNDALTGAKIGYDGTNNWSAQAITNNQVPMLIHYVHGGNESLVTNSATRAANETAVSDVKFDVTLTAEYPIVNFAGSNARFKVAEDPAAYEMTSGSEMSVMTVPTQLTSMYVNSASVTTGIEGALTEALGGWRIYPNPVNDEFKLQAPMIISNVKIFSVDGQLVKEVNTEADTTVTINVEDLPEGLYFVNTLGVSKIMIKK